MSAFCTHVDHFVFSSQVSVTTGGTELTNVHFGSFSYRSFSLRVQIIRTKIIFLDVYIITYDEVM